MIRSHPLSTLATFTLLILLMPHHGHAIDLMELKTPNARGYGLDTVVRRALYIHYFNVDPFEKIPDRPSGAQIGLIPPPCHISELKDGLARNTCSPLRLSERCGKNCFTWLMDPSVFETHNALIQDAMREPCKHLSEVTLPEGIVDAHPPFFFFGHRLASSALHCDSWVKLRAKSIEYRDSRLIVNIGGLW